MCSFDTVLLLSAGLSFFDNEYPKKSQLSVVYSAIVIAENSVCNMLLGIPIALYISASASQPKLSC